MGNNCKGRVLRESRGKTLYDTGGNEKFNSGLQDLKEPSSDEGHIRFTLNFHAATLCYKSP